ncbi:MSMEG_0570 family nitrogen starvation response protein [Agarilytica rhodophyticola]|uniref:MSMEG_0570 family nitrogen starvation response protein n=1 Tax=Agarilytica rhodophyticola TaxID=1737490 RepID=UPI000B347092|nr:MSMEG_0570 family nitrogen starvation response protein [Agarilytica rhodophyticola]
MPAVHFNVAWPDGISNRYYSPSTVIFQYLNEGQAYSIEEFSEKVIAALENASIRVEKKYGYACSAAADEASKIKQKIHQLKTMNVQGNVTFKNYS